MDSGIHSDGYYHGGLTGTGARCDWCGEQNPEKPAPTEYDRRAAAWVRKRFPDAKPDIGSVEFSTDCAAYASGGWAQVDVAWTEGGATRASTLIDEAWQADLTTIIRELVDMPLDG